MATLPLVDWPGELIEQRLSFLRSAARFVPPPADDGERASARHEPSRGEITDVHALLAAVDMAFATNRTAVGLDMLNDAVDTMIKRGDLQIAALPGSILGRVATEIAFDRIDIIDRASGRRSWEALPPPSPTTLNLMSDLLIASLAGVTPGDRAGDYFDRWPEPVLGLGEPLLQALAAFHREDDWPAAQTGLVANTALWIEHLGRCRRDTFHWQQGRVRGRLIDFRRVAFEIALIRRADGRRFREWWGSGERAGLAGAIDDFVRRLATEIVER